MLVVSSQDLWPLVHSKAHRGESKSCPYGSWIYNNLCNQCQTPLMLWLWVRVMACNATFNYISVISWRSVLLVEQPGETHGPVTDNTLSLKVASNIPRPERDSNSQSQWWYALITQAVVNSTTMRPWLPEGISYNPFLDAAICGKKIAGSFLRVLWFPLPIRLTATI